MVASSEYYSKGNKDIATTTALAEQRLEPVRIYLQNVDASQLESSYCRVLNQSLTPTSCMIVLLYLWYKLRIVEKAIDENGNPYRYSFSWITSQRKIVRVTEVVTFLELDRSAL
jgi:hypothetical protein